MVAERSKAYNLAVKVYTDLYGTPFKLEDLLSKTLQMAGIDQTSPAYKRVMDLNNANYKSLREQWLLRNHLLGFILNYDSVQKCAGVQDCAKVVDASLQELCCHHSTTTADAFSSYPAVCFRDLATWLCDTSHYPANPPSELFLGMCWLPKTTALSAASAALPMAPHLACIW